MAKWEQSTFGSYNSFTPPWQLSPEQLPVCTNVKINDGQAVPIREDATVTTGLTADAYLGIHKFGNIWVAQTMRTYFCEFMGLLTYLPTGGAQAYITDGSTTEDLGSALPSDIVTAAAGGAGPITNASLQYYVSFVDGLGQESGLSDGSTAIAVTDKEVTVTNIPTRTGCTRRLYRNNGNAIQWVATLNTSDTSYTDSKGPTELGDAPPETALVGGTAPALSLLCQSPHQGRLFGASSEWIYFSAIGYPGIWHATSSIRWNRPVTALATLGNSMLVLGNNSAEFLDGSDAETFAFRRGDRYGTAHPFSVVDCGRYGVAYWSPRGLVLCDGSNFALLTDTLLSEDEVSDFGGGGDILGGYWNDRIYLFGGEYGLVYDLKRKALSRTDAVVDAVHSNAVDNRLYVQIGTSTYHWEGGTANRIQQLRTKDHNPGTLDGAYHVTEVGIEHSGDFTVRVIENGEVFDEQEISRSEMGFSYLMVPPGCWGPRQAIELEGTGTARQIVWNPDKENV